MQGGIDQQTGMRPGAHEDLENGTLGPSANGDPMGTPGDSERVLWKGRPDLLALSRTAFHTRSVALYFGLLIAISLILGNVNTAITCIALAFAALAILHLLAWHSRRTTLYILTDARLIMRIGMAVETRINIPLKHVRSADLKMRGKDHGDIALRLGGERLLGYFLMWPHARPWRFAQPEPMLRAIPDAEKVARLLAEACGASAPIEQNLTKINVPAAQSGQRGQAATARAVGNASGSKEQIGDTGLEGAPA